MKENALRKAQRFAWASGLLLGLLASREEAWPQSAPARVGSAQTVEPGKALADGIRLYRRGDFERAAGAFAHAERGAAKLSAQDQNVLQEYAGRASRAMSARSQAHMELMEAQSAYDTGDMDKARSLIVRVQSNRFVSAPDMAASQELDSKLRDPETKGSGWSPFKMFARKKPPVLQPAPDAPVESVPPPITQVGATQPAPGDALNVYGDARQLLREGRRFFKKGLVDQAEKFATAAAEVKVAWDPAKDSPQRLLREIDAYRTKHGLVRPDVKETEAPLATPEPPAAAPSPIVDSSSAVSDPRTQALALLAEGRKLVAAGNLDGAKEIAVRVYAMQVGLTASDPDTPEALYADVKKKLAEREQSPMPPAQPAPQPAAGDQSSSVLPATSEEDPADAVADIAAEELPPPEELEVNDPKVEAAALVRLAREKFDAERYQEAILLAQSAQNMGVEFDPREDSPEKIFKAHAAIRARVHDRKNAAQTAAKSEQAHKLVAKAKAHLDAGNFPVASRLAQEALTLRGLFQPGELTPSELLVEIQRRSMSVPRFAPVSEITPSRTDSEITPVAYEEIENPPTSEAPPADEGLVQTAGPGNAAGLMDMGLNAHGRGDVEQALAFFREAAKYANSLDPVGRQRLQKLTRACEDQLAGGARPKPGRAVASDVTQFIASEQPAAAPSPAPEPGTEIEQDEIAKAKQRQAILLQKIRQDVIEALEQANLQLRENPDEAINTLTRSLDAVKASGLDEDQTANLVNRLESQIRQYQAWRQRYIFAEIENDQRKANEDARTRQIHLELQKQNQIKQLSIRFNELMRDYKYQEAEAVAYQIMEIDPDEPFGAAAVLKAQLSSRYDRIEDVEWRKQKGWWEALMSAELSSIPIPDNQEVTFPDPKTWEELSQRRLKYKRVTLEEKSEATAEIERQLEKPISFEFRDSPLTDVVTFLRDYTNVNVYLDPNGLQNLGIEDSEPITLELDKVPLKSALRLLLKPLGLTYIIENDVLLLTDAEETGARPVVLVYPVADLVIPITNFATGGLGVSGGGGGIGGGGGLGGGGGFGGGGGGFGGGGGGFGGGGGGFGGGGGGFGGGGGGGGIGGGGNINQDINEDVIELIQNTVAPDTWEAGGGSGTIEYFQPNRSFVISQSPEVHEKVAELFDQLRRLQDLQVSVEVRFITVSESFFERIGIDFDISIDNNNDQFIINDFNQQNGPPGVPVLQDNNGVGFSDGNHLRGVTIGRDPSGVRTSNYNIPITQSSFAAATVPALAGLGATNLGGTNFGIAFLNDIDVFMLLEAVQGDRRANTLQAPKVTLFNGQTANVRVTDQVPFVTDATPVISAGAVTFDPTIETIQDGTTVQVQAVVSADRRFVRLTVVPLLQTIEPLEDVRTVDVGGTAGGGVFGQAGSATVTIQLPIVSQVTVLTTVSVPDGGTVLLGGLKTHREARNEFGTPVISKIPYINRLFKNAATARVTDSLMLLVSPRIIILEEEEEKLGVQTGTPPIR